MFFKTTDKYLAQGLLRSGIGEIPRDRLAIGSLVVCASVVMAV